MLKDFLSIFIQRRKSNRSIDQRTLKILLIRISIDFYNINTLDNIFNMSLNKIIESLMLKYNNEI